MLGTQSMRLWTTVPSGLVFSQVLLTTKVPQNFCCKKLPMFCVITLCIFTFCEYCTFHLLYWTAYYVLVISYDLRTMTVVQLHALWFRHCHHSHFITGCIIIQPLVCLFTQKRWMLIRKENMILNGCKLKQWWWLMISLMSMKARKNWWRCGICMLWNMGEEKFSLV